jgi:hypothetical protein
MRAALANGLMAGVRLRDALPSSALPSSALPSSARLAGVWLAGVTLAAVLLAGLPACSPDAVRTTSFAAPDAAAEALFAAVESNDAVQLRALFGPDSERLIASGDDVADGRARAAFVERYRARHQWVSGGPSNLVLQVGEDAWPVPVHLVEEGGKWRFDTASGAEELLARRIGTNELRTIDVMRGFVMAQLDYAATGHDRGEPGLYAQKLRSSPGMQDGLYWEVAAGEPPSPAGPLLAAAAAEGYSGTRVRQPYHGYMFRQLYSQGSHADGGARVYLENGKLSGGFALLAWPMEYGSSGVMTLMVNHDGVVWQRDFGPDTPALVAQIERFDPDASWMPIPAEGHMGH